jgi:hypothetical protein
MQKRLSFHLAGVLLLTAAVFTIFLQRPGLGDDFSYWKVGYGLAENLRGAWRTGNFHDLRWPVWGLCWLFFKLTGSSLAAYYAPPLLILSLSAATVFLVTHRIGNRLLPAWGATGLFLLNPLVDAVAYRPMPDLSEGLWTGFAILSWAASMRSERAGRSALFSLVCGFFIALAHSNRFTGLLTIPALGLLTLLFFPRKWPWYLACVAAAIGFIAVECLVYKQMTGDFLYSLHTNMGAKGKKGTGPVNILFLPVRFIDKLWKGGTGKIGPVYFITAILGGIALWRQGGFRRRLPAAWALVMFLAYSCAVQQIWPPRPMLRDAERFLAAIAMPLAILSANGWGLIYEGARKYCRLPQRWLAFGEKRTAWLVAAGLLLLAVCGGRGWFDPGYIPEFRAYVASRPEHTRVLTHLSMWYFTHLIAQKEAERVDFITKLDIHDWNPEVEKLASESDEIWFSRKLILLRPRQELRDDDPEAGGRLASFLDAPQENWRCAELIKIDAKPELVFYQRRKESEPTPLVISAQSVAGAPSLPCIWKSGKKEASMSLTVPEAARGKRVRIRMVGASNTPHSLDAVLEFTDGSHRMALYEIVPVFGKQPTVDFFDIEVPERAAKANIKIKFARSATHISLSDLEFVAN